MPYIPEKRRARFFADTHALGGKAEHSGELNFVIINLLCAYLHKQGICYESFNEVIGVLECAKQELYRRIVAPYENAKCAENGDVFRGVSGE